MTRFRLRQLARRATMPHDTWERHEIVRRLIRGATTVLDVGGVAGELQAFLPSAKVTTLNVGDEQSDLHYDGRRIPFADGAFEAAVSLDVLEHLDPTERRGHVEELERVTEGRIVICCPLGTQEHVDAERELAAWYQRVTERPHRFLEEHLAAGLPREEELRWLASSADLQLRFQGDFRSANELFRLGVLVRTRPTPGLAARYLRSRFTRNRSVELTADPHPYTNRAFLIGACRPQ